MGIHAGEALKCCKQSLMGNFGGSSKDHDVDKNADNEYCALEI